MKIVETGCIKIPMHLCCKPGLFCEIAPTKSQNGAGYRFQNGSLQKISPFRGALDFLGPKMALGCRLMPFKGLSFLHRSITVYVIVAIVRNAALFGRVLLTAIVLHSGE